ncbi:cytochrome b-c1 complex subunit 2, mitochondrial [Lepeophtheirus salmonis]|uniref:Cytochrome b-c1 complex subunit 2, mitochondrial n=1 Tax=Lepeophtheirus salmonis TaxID=72036 RepID=C1BSJ3_LEPSM|nr:cytochrome b-c1 complex subunit 2, mitochondrial-like [Lepeophtheirus salmonis]ACO11996.1 Cytochrome b-c1 complex subunit 2, mitochondrial precursor [Lepeophtheirus salmonis]
MSLLRTGCRYLSSGKSSASVAAAVKSEQTHSPPKYETNKSVSGIHYCNLDNPKPIVNLMVMVNGAGSSSETYKNEGVSHALRLSCGLSTKNFTRFGTIRNVQQLGTALECIQTRENLIYSMKIHRDYFLDGLDFLRENVVCPSLKKWEIEDSIASAMKLEIEQMNPLIKAQEELLRVSYRRGLGNSLFCPERNIGAISNDMIRDFHSTHFNMENVIFGANGIDQMTARRLADTFHLPSGKAESSIPSKFHVGESRIDTRDSNVHIAFGSGTQLELKNPGDHTAVIANYLLSIILGKGISVKRGQGIGKLTQGLRSALGDVPFGVSSLYNEFEHTTVIGANIITEASSAGKAIDAALKTIKELKISEKDLQGAKKRAEIDFNVCIEEQADNLLGALSLFHLTGNPNMEGWIDLIHTISVSDVQAAADRMAKSKFSMSSVGNLVNVPYLDSLQ